MVLVHTDAFKVRRVVHPGGRVSHWVFDAAGVIHRPALEVLKRFSESTQETYAYCLVDHLRWLATNQLRPSTISVDDLYRYMNGLTGNNSGVYGIAWRDKPMSDSAAANVATIVKAYYLSLPDVSPELKESLSTGGAIRSKGGRRVTPNPIAPRRASPRPRFLPDDVIEALFRPGVLTSSRNLMILTWLRDSGIRVGGLCGLRFCDLHLMLDHPCGQRRDPHIHIVGRDDNPNRARAKAYSGHNVSPEGHILDGVIRAVSDEMVATFYGYLLDEYYPIQHLVDHDQVLVHIKGRHVGSALTTSGVRKMLRKGCERAGLPGYVTPHAFRHKAAADLYEASDFNADLVAQEFGWARPEQVSDLYGRSANRKAMRFLKTAWDSATVGGAERQLSMTAQQKMESP